MLPRVATCALAACIGDTLDLARIGRAVEEIEVEGADAVDGDVTREGFAEAGEGDIRTVRTGAAPVVRVVALGLEQLRLRAVEVECRAGEQDVGTRVGDVEHGTALDLRAERRVDGLELRALAGRGVRVTGGRLVDDHTVRDRVRRSLIRDRAAELRIVDLYVVKALHAGDLAALGGAGHVAHFDRTSRIDERGTAAACVQRAVRDADVSAATVRREARGVVASGVNRHVVGDDRAAVGGVEAAGVALRGRDAVLLAVDGRAVRREDRIRAFTVGGQC